MNRRLMPISSLLGYGALWMFGLWLAIVPADVQRLWVRLFRTDAFVPPRLALRLIGALWVALLTIVVAFNLRARNRKP
jgi:hypothetical protein